MKNILLPLLLAAFAAMPAHATLVYFQGTFDTGGTLASGTFSGDFDISFPIGTTFETLSTFDVFLKKGGTTVEIKNGQSNSFAEVFANDEAVTGGLNFQFIDAAFDSLNLFFTVPFTGNAPVLLHTSTGYAANGTLANGTDTLVKTGIASTSPLPEPGTWLLTGLGALLIYVSRR
jgi:hypothetical protein